MFVDGRPLVNQHCWMGYSPEIIEIVIIIIIIATYLKSSSNDAIKSLWRSTLSVWTFNMMHAENTKQVLKAVRQNHTDKLRSNLTSQGFIITFLLNHSLKSVNSPWSSAQSKLPKSIFNFTVRYLNNTLATRKNLTLWNLSQMSACSFCFQQESLSTLLQAVDPISARAASPGDMTLH